jgi:hypothetical protein
MSSIVHIGRIEMSKIDLYKGDYVELVDNLYFMRVDTEVTHTVSVTMYEITAWGMDNSPCEAEKIGSAYVKFDGSIHMWLGDEEKYSYINDVDSYCKMIKQFSQICLNLVSNCVEYIDDSIKIKKQILPNELKLFIDNCHKEKEDTVVEKRLFDE